MIDSQDEMSAELAGDAIEVMIWTLISIQLTRFVILGVVKFLHPCAFDDLECLRDDLRIFLIRMFILGLAVFQFKEAVLHLFFRLVSRPTHPDSFLEQLGIIGDEVEGTLTGSQNVLCRIG